jgi:D-sedoheptulose 7-phosphate isomerase
MGLVESIHLTLFHWVLNDLFARINHCGRHADGTQPEPKKVYEGL